MEHKILFFIESQWPLLIGAVALIVMIFKGPLTRKAAGIQEVDPVAAVQLINHEDAVIIDTRRLCCLQLRPCAMSKGLGVR